VPVTEPLEAAKFTAPATRESALRVRAPAALSGRPGAPPRGRAVGHAGRHSHGPNSLATAYYNTPFIRPKRVAASFFFSRF
jgi:hypothetical protein